MLRRMESAAAMATWVAARPVWVGRVGEGGERRLGLPGYTAWVGELMAWWGIQKREGS
jgi:hypothetical protein